MFSFSLSLVFMFSIMYVYYEIYLAEDICSKMVLGCLGISFLLEMISNAYSIAMVFHIYINILYFKCIRNLYIYIIRNCDYITKYCSIHSKGKRTSYVFLFIYLYIYIYKGRKYPHATRIMCQLICMSRVFKSSKS